MELKQFSLILFFLLLIVIPTETMARIPTQTAASGATKTEVSSTLYAVYTWATFLIGGIVVVIGILLTRPWPTWGKYTALTGLFIITIGLFLIEIAYLLPMVGKPVVSYKKCEGTLSLWSSSSSQTKDPAVKLMETTACIFSGYVTTQLLWESIIVFFIFGLIVPFAMIIALFYEFTKDFLEHPMVRRVVAFTAGLLAYRYLLATLFLDVLGYGFAGVAILLVDLLLLYAVFRGLSRFWRGYEELSEMLAVQNRDTLYDLLRRRDNLLNAYKNSSGEKQKEVEEELNDVEKKIKELQKTMGLTKRLRKK